MERRTARYGPLGVARVKISEIGTPWPLAKPAAALVGLPTESKAELNGCPVTSSSMSGWTAASPKSPSASRRGPPQISIFSKGSLCWASSRESLSLR